MVIVYRTDLPSLPAVQNPGTRGRIPAACPGGAATTRVVSRHGMGQRTPCRPSTPVVKNSRSMSSTGLTPARLHTARTRLYTVENATSTESPGITRTAPGVTHILLAAHCAVMCLSLLVEPWSDLARTSHPGTARPCRCIPCMPSAMTISSGSSPRRRSVRRWRAADERSATSAPRARIVTRAHSAVGTLPAAAANSRSPGHPAVVAPLPAASATRAGNVASPDGPLWRVANPGPRAAGAIALFADLGVPLSSAMSRAVCAVSAFAFARAIGGPPRAP